jgi:hypothetical protein
MKAHLNALPASVHVYRSAGPQVPQPAILSWHFYHSQVSHLQLSDWL